MNGLMHYGFGILISSSMIGCASLPDATLTYYLPKSAVSIIVNQTVLCRDISMPIVETSVRFVPIISADITRAKEIQFSELDSFYASGSAEVKLTSDGRIQGFNSSMTGSTSQVVSTLESFADLVGFESSVTQSDVDVACTEINRIAGSKDGVPLPLSLLIKTIVNFEDGNNVRSTGFRLENYPQSLYEKFEPALGKLTLTSRASTDRPIPVRNSDNSSVAITLVKPASVPLVVELRSSLVDGTMLFGSSVPVPQWGVEYSVPIPRPPLFGTNTLDLTLFETGEIKSIKYGTNSGAKDLGGTLSSVKNYLEETDAELAAALKAEADVLAQQQRLIVCRATPDLCK